MKRRTVLFFTILLLRSFAVAQNTYSLHSPSANLKAEIRVGGNVSIDLFAGDEKMVTTRTLQFTMDKEVAHGDWLVADRQRNSVDQTWQPLYGERHLVPEQYNELELSLQSAADQKNLSLKVRLYNEGLAFQYAFDKDDFWGRILKSEDTRFLFAEDCTTWVTSKAQGSYSSVKLSEMAQIAERPQVVELSGRSYVAIGEAALVDYSRMKLGKCDSGFGLQTYLSGPVDLALADYHSPWRYVMVAEHPGKLVENNYFVLNLNEPNQIRNTAWIKPGRAIREVTLTTAGGLACVDFAAKNGIEYVEFDAGWYGPEYNEASDATTITVDPARSKGPLDLHKVIAYADSKGVGIWVYVNMRALRRQLDEILPLYKEWGIKGVKFGFVDVGDQYSTVWLHRAVRLAAKYELMVDIHDEYRPTGYSRTYPNLMTQEGIRGDEESPSLEQTVHTFYNRMICGAGDYTNCYFAERVQTKMGGKAAQLAKLVALYSPLQFIYWYDRPQSSPARAGGAGAVESVIKEDEVTRFYHSIPTVWDESKFMGGEPGKYTVVARRAASDWYVGILNAGDSRRVSLPLNFVTCPDDYEAVLYYQASGNQEVCMKKVKLSNPALMEIDVPENSGCVLYLFKNVHRR